ncbi:hypothetical protein BWQ96_08539 [Gracilariopsis chorda]|uniref:Uncharacterized protein n=1 Tax=Gracilariopsis chorda TaxID=448386 RepID=A0A2V3IKU1_9FLOR|nr:hypothetical protein BWQ96_08539 [Gracilariopsis chorda]|eukprot:PXF41750.1 hypothetical protein BWQ96_08539 [Gracilariopsis chorda]
MSEKPRPQSSMASVWDTLNKMKARQKAAESTSRQHKRFDTAKKDAVLLFERQIDLAVSKNLTDGCAALREMRHAMDADENVRAVIDNHKERLKSTDVRHELSALRDIVDDTANVLSVAGTCITKAHRIAQPLR